MLLVALLFLGVAASIVDLTLSPAPAFLVAASSIPMAAPGEGLALIAWSGMRALFVLIGGALVDARGYKRIFMFAIIFALFGAAGMAASVAVAPHPVATSLFWIATTIGAATQAIATVAAFSGIYAFVDSRLSGKFALALGVSAHYGGMALGGLIHAPLAWAPFVDTIAAHLLAVEHVPVVVALVVVTAAVACALLTTPFVRKQRVPVLRYEGGCRASLEPMTRRSFWKLVLASVFWIGASAVLRYTLYVAPISMTRGHIVPAFPLVTGGAVVATVYGAVALLAPPIQLLTTGVHPLWCMAAGAFLAVAAPAFMLVTDAGMLGPAAVVGAALTIVLGTALWWPRFLAYAADVARTKTHVGTFLSVALASVYLSDVLALAGVASIANRCAGVAACSALMVWPIALALPAGFVLVALVLLCVTADTDTRARWKDDNALLDPEEDTELDTLGHASRIMLDDSSSSSDGAKRSRLQEEESNRYSMGVALGAE